MVFITAELGTTWQGDFISLVELVDSCKKMGFDAIKLQALNEEKLARHTELSYYKKASVTKENINEINEICTRLQIEWYCTPTYPEAVDFLEPFVNRYKISVHDSTNLKLLDKVFSTGKEVIISSEKPLKDIKGKATRVKNLYCIPKYPTKYEEINFEIISQFDGFSNHCINPLAMLQAVERKIKYLEFHITSSRDHFLIDNNVSFNLLEAYDVVRWIRYYESWNNSPGKINELRIPE